MALIKCPECHSEISDQAPSCPQCGYPFPARSSTLNRPGQQITITQIPQETPRTPDSGCLSAVIVLAIIGAIVYFIANRYDNNISSTITRVIPLERKLALVDGNIYINAGKYSYYEFDTKSNWQDIKVSGSFDASGGRGNDIRVLLMTKDDFINYTNKHPSKAIYDSDKISVSDLNVNLPSKTENYVLAFDNTYSVVSDKKISANINLAYKGL